MEEKTTRQELEEILAKLGISMSSSQDGEKTVLTLQDEEDSREVLKITEDSEEAAYKKVLDALFDAMVCYKAIHIFGDLLGGIVIIK